MRKERRVKYVEEMVPQVVQKEVDVWIADDGKEFDTEVACVLYNKELNAAKMKEVWKKWTQNKLEIPMCDDEVYLAEFKNEREFVEFDEAAEYGNNSYSIEWSAPNSYPCKEIFYISETGWADFVYDSREKEDMVREMIARLRESADKLEAFFFSAKQLAEDEWTCPVCGGALNHEGVSYCHHDRIYSDWTCTKCGRTGTAISEETYEVNFVEHQVNEEE